MAKFTTGQLKKSLFDNITLMESTDKDGLHDYVWAEFHEIESYINDGFKIFNNDKAIFYNKKK